MAVALVQSYANNQKTTASTLAVTLTSGSGSCNAIVVFTQCTGGSLSTNISGITDSQGNTYGPLGRTQIGADNTKNFEVWICMNPTALTNNQTVTITWSQSSTARAAGVATFSGVARGFLVTGVSAGNAGCGATENLLMSAGSSATLAATLQTASNRMWSKHAVLALYGLNGPVGDTYTNPTGYSGLTGSGTTGSGATSNCTVRGSYLVEDTLTITTPINATNSTSRNYAAMGVCLIEDITSTEDTSVQYITEVDANSGASAVNSRSVTLPSAGTMNDGDVMVALINFDAAATGAPRTVTWPSGWTEVTNKSLGILSDYNNEIWIGWKACVGDQGASTTFTVSGNAGEMTVVVLVYRNVDNTSPFGTPTEGTDFTYWGLQHNEDGGTITANTGFAKQFTNAPSGSSPGKLVFTGWQSSMPFDYTDSEVGSKNVANFTKRVYVGSTNNTKIYASDFGWAAPYQFGALHYGNKASSNSTGQIVFFLNYGVYAAPGGPPQIFKEGQLRRITGQAVMRASVW